MNELAIVIRDNNDDGELHFIIQIVKLYEFHHSAGPKFMACNMHA